MRPIQKRFGLREAFFDRTYQQLLWIDSALGSRISNTVCTSVLLEIIGENHENARLYPG